MNVSADEIYKMLTIIEQHADELAKADPSYKQIGGGKMAAFQKQALESTYALVPIHPGLAKYLKAKISGMPSSTPTLPRRRCKDGTDITRLAWKCACPFAQKDSYGSAMTDMPPQSQYRPPLVLDCIYYAIAVGFALYMFYYYWTGANGETFLALGAIPITYVLFTLRALRANELYPELPFAANYVIAAAIPCSRSIAPIT